MRNAVTRFVNQVAGKSMILAIYFSQDGGLRGLFDAASSEYQSFSMSGRVEKLTAMRSAGFSIETMREPFVDVMISSGYTKEDGNTSFDNGVRDLLDYMIGFQLKTPLAQLAEQAE